MVFFLFALTIIAAGLVFPALLRFRLHITLTRCDLFADIFLFFHLIKLPMHFILTFNEGSLVRVFRVSPGGQRKAVYFKKRKGKRLPFRAIVNGIKIKKLSLYTRIGTQEADKTALICGAAESIFRSVCSVFCKNAEASIYPDFKRHVFILNLEGILHINHVKIILKAFSKR